MKKKLSIFSVLAFLLLATISLSTSCKKSKKGVIEAHQYMTEDGEKVSNSDLYICYVLDEKSISLIDGELIYTTDDSEADAALGISNIREYVYWENESARSLGYKHKWDKESEDILGYKTKGTFSDKDANWNPGENGFWGSNGPSTSSAFSVNDIVGHWKHDGSGLEIQINSGTSGNATVLEPGTAFPPAADGGQCMIDINYQGNGEWTGMYRTYYNGSGWQNSSTVIFYMASDKQSFTLGGATYHKI